MSDKERIEGLEIKVSYMERLLEQLNEVVTDQAAALDETRAEVEALKTAFQARDAEAKGPVLGAHPEEDPVPHAG